MTDALTQSEQTQPPAESPNSAGKAASRRSRKSPAVRWLWVILMLLLVGVGVQQLMALRFWETLDNEAGQIASVDGRLTALEAAMADQVRLREDVLQMQRVLQRERAQLALERLEQQLDAGWQRWLGTGDTGSLIATMQAAQQWLANQPGAGAQAVRLALSRDLVTIKSQGSMDLQLAVQNIDAVIATIDRLPLIQEARIPHHLDQVSAGVSEVADSGTLLDRARETGLALARDIWVAIRSMVRVQRLDRAEPELVAPAQKVFLQQGLRLLLLDARHALIMRNAETYQETLRQAHNWIMKYAEPSDTLVKADLEALQRLAAINIDPLAISLEDTRQALTAARAALIDEVVVEAAPQHQTQAPKEIDAKQADMTAAPSKEATQ